VIPSKPPTELYYVTHTRLSAAIFETICAAARGKQVEMTLQRNSEITKKHIAVFYDLIAAACVIYCKAKRRREVLLPHMEIFLKC